MSDNPKESEKQMEKAIFISGDCWLAVFDLLPPSQLGLEIAMISHRFDRRVDEHFKTRKRTLDKMEIRRKNGMNATYEMEIVNSDEETLPIPQNPLPSKVIGFRSILITYIDQNVLTFLRRFDRFFVTCETKIHIHTVNVRVLKFAVLNIWPIFKDTLRVLYLNPIAFGHMRQFAPSILTDCPSLRVVDFDNSIFPEFPSDGNTNADGHAVVKWLYTPHPDNSPKVLFVEINNDARAARIQWPSTVKQIKAEFATSSSPVNFVISVTLFTVEPFELTNQLTGEKLKLSIIPGRVSLIRCPIAAAVEGKWTKEINEFIRGRENKKIDVYICHDRVDKSLLNAASAGPGGDH